MPNYTFTCHCGAESLRIRSVDQRDDPLACFSCGSAMQRETVGSPYVRADTNFKMQAITESGQKVPGSFTGAKKRGWLSANQKKR